MTTAPFQALTHSAEGTYGLMGDARVAMPSQYDADRTDGMREAMNMFYRTIRHQQPVLKVKVTSALPSLLKNALEKIHVVRMDSLKNQIGC